MKKYVLGAIILIFALGSCASPRKIAQQVEFRGVVGIETGGMSEMTLLFDINNGSNKNIHIKNGELNIKNGQRTLARVNVEDVVIKKRSSGAVPFPLKVSYNQMALLAAVSGMSGKQALTVSGAIKLRAGAVGKTFRIEDMPLQEFLDKFGMDIDKETLSKMMKQL